jgi:hypothetical protein
VVGGVIDTAAHKIGDLIVEYIIEYASIFKKALLFCIRDPDVV